MPSILPPSQMARSCNGCLNQSSRKIEQLTGMYMSDDSQKSNSSLLGRKRKNKKRPPPISISASAGSVKDLKAGNSSRTFHDGYWTPPTPQTPPLVPCMKQLCKEVHDYLIATPTLSQPKHHPDHIWPPRVKSSIMSSAELPAELPTNPSAEIAELPASEPSQQHAEQLHELDASSPSSTLTCVKIQKSDITPSDTPELSPSSETTSAMESAFWAFPARPTKSIEPVKNGKLLSRLNIHELLDVYPELSPLEIEEHWRPLVARECNIMKETLKEYNRHELQRLQNPNPTPQVVYKTETPEEANERRKSEHILETTRVEKECENRLNEKDAELLSLKTAYESKAAILSTFIDRYHDLNHSSDPYAPSIKDLVNKHSLIRERATNPDVNGQFIYVSEKEHTERTLELEMFRFQLDDLDRLVNYYEDKAKTFGAQNKSLEKEVEQYKKAEFQHAKDIVEKDIQIASVSLKNAQMMKMHPPYSHQGSHTGGSGHSSVYGRGQPSLNMTEWVKKYERMEDQFKEEVKQKERDAAVLNYKEEMMARLPGYVTKSGEFSVPRFGGGAGVSAVDSVTNSFQTLNVEGEKFPFHMADN